MKIALVSEPVRNKNIVFNVQTMIAELKKYSGKADVVLFGEAVLQGFDSLCWEYERDKHMAVKATDEPIRQMRKAAEENKIAVCFGLIERLDETLYSSQIFIGADGEIVTVYRRLSVGWKEYTKTDTHYREGKNFERFQYGGKQFAIGLCGDLWTDGRPEEMKALHTDVVLWPVWCDYEAEEWNKHIKYEYAHQAALCGEEVLLVNPFCADVGVDGCAAGGCAHFQNGKIKAEHPAGGSCALMAKIE